MFTLEGKVWKEGKFWLIEVPALDIMTQGHTKDEAYEMITDAIKTHIDVESFSVSVKPQGTNDFIIFAEDSKDVALLIGLLLKQQRAKNHLSLEDMREKLGVKSRSNYAQYEKGRILPSIGQVTSFLKAMGLQAILSFNIAQVAKVRYAHVRKYR